MLSYRKLAMCVLGVPPTYELGVLIHPVRPLSGQRRLS